MPPASPYGVGSRRNSQASRAKKAIYSSAPRIPLVISSSHSWPVLPTCCWPHCGQAGVGPMLIEVALPCRWRVSPEPRTG